MKLTFIFCILIMFTTVSCTYDFDAEEFDDDFKPQAILNSFLIADSNIIVDLYWSKHYTDYSAYKEIDKFGVVLYENNAVVYKNNQYEGKLKTTIKAKEGHHYKIEVTIPNYDKLVWAETYIPKASFANTSFVSLSGPPMYCHFKVDNISLNDSIRSLIIQNKGIYIDTNYTKVITALHSNNTFFDQFNMIMDSYDVEYSNSPTYFDEFIRIPYKNINLALPIEYSFRGLSEYSNTVYAGENIWGEPVFETKYYQWGGVLIEIISPSSDFDRYLKSVYEQRLYGDIDMPIFINPKMVYSNINNGIGIFAGYSLLAVEYKIENNHLKE